jgi:hypothetical protein
MIRSAIITCLVLTFSGSASAETPEQIIRRMNQPTAAPQFPSLVEKRFGQPIQRQLNQATEAWTRASGEYVPNLVRQEYYKRISNQISATVGPKLAEEESNFDGVGSTLGTVYNPRDAASVAQAVTDRFTTPQAIGLWLQQYPTVRIIVQPTPPKEFLLTINGEACPATERAIYRVPAGEVTVRVWRLGSALCEKTYNTTAGNVYDVQCTF